VAQSAAGSDIADAPPDQIATAQLGVDGAVEQRQVANPIARFELLSNAPDVLRFQRRLPPMGSESYG
jgi:hypothetical protein